MMTTTSSFRNTLCRQIAVIPFLAFAFFMFSSKTMAQQAADSVKAGTTKVPFTKEGLTQAQLDEYAAIVDKYKTTDGKISAGKITEADQKRLSELFLLMSKEQQEKQTLIFIAAAPPLPKTVPSATQFQSFKNSKVYGVWIDGKRVSNSALGNYTHTDFAQVSISKLYGAAKKGRSYTHQVDLMTTAYYNNYYQETMASKNKYFIGLRVVKKP